MCIFFHKWTHWHEFKRYYLRIFEGKEYQVIETWQKKTCTRCNKIKVESVG